MAAADVGHVGTGLEFLHDPFQRREPGGDEVGVVARPEEPLGAVEDVVTVFMPAKPGAAAGDLRDSRRIEDRPDRDLEEARQVGRTVFIGQRHRLLSRECVTTLNWVILHVTSRRLGVEPLTHIALSDAGALSQLARRQRPRSGKRTVQAKPITTSAEFNVAPTSSTARNTNAISLS